MRCPLRFLTHFLNARHTQKCIPAQSRCLFIASPHRLSASPHHRLNDLTIVRFNDYSGPLIFLLRLGIINAGHFDRLSDRIASALAAQETRQAQGPNRIALLSPFSFINSPLNFASTTKRFNDSAIVRFNDYSGPSTSSGTE